MALHPLRRRTESAADLLSLGFLEPERCSGRRTVVSARPLHAAQAIAAAEASRTEPFQFRLAFDRDAGRDAERLGLPGNVSERRCEWKWRLSDAWSRVAQEAIHRVQRRGNGCCSREGDGRAIRLRSVAGASYREMDRKVRKHSVPQPCSVTGTLRHPSGPLPAGFRARARFEGLPRMTRLIETKADRFLFQLVRGIRQKPKTS